MKPKKPFMIARPDGENSVAQFRRNYKGEYTTFWRWVDWDGTAFLTRADAHRVLELHNGKGEPLSGAKIIEIIEQVRKTVTWC